ncbi:MAG: mucoidy inhibitor MuiA family protein [Chloroflexi bacterium]|nr:mucoidy inhibitor MuiA family protein [Chloroflexota bacterium]
MEITVEAAISKVTVYPDRARVTHRGECDVAPGIHKLLFEELPLALMPDSVRAVGSGTARARLLGVDVSRRYYEETPAERVGQLEREIEQVNDEMRVLEDDKAGWLAHGKYLDGLRQATVEFAKGLSRGRTSIEDQAQLTQFLREQDEILRTAVRDIESQRRELKRRLDKLNRELKELGSAQPRKRYQARIEIEVIEEGSFQPELTYLARNAGWQPLYDARLVENGDERAVEVSYIAQVTQNTGQDWQGVDLVVSTARPALNQRLPELKPWYVDVYAPPRPQPRQKPKAVRMAAAPAPAAAMDAFTAVPESTAPVAEAKVAVAAVQDSGTAVSFAVSGKIDIPSDGSPHKTTLNQFSLDPKLDYLAAPKHTHAVYRRATIVNNSPSPLMPGVANLFVGDEFIGRTRLEYSPAGDEIELLLGVEERITIERELVKRDVDRRRLRDNRQLRYGYEIKVENLLKTAVQLEIHDHIPVSRHEQIKVKLEQTRPDPVEKSDLNLLEWHLRLAAGAEQTIGYEYSVEHPRSLRVAGLLD